MNLVLLLLALASVVTAWQYYEMIPTGPNDTIVLITVTFSLALSIIVLWYLDALEKQYKRYSELSGIIGELRASNTPSPWLRPLFALHGLVNVWGVAYFYAESADALFAQLIPCYAVLSMVAGIGAAINCNFEKSE